MKIVVQSNPGSTVKVTVMSTNPSDPPAASAVSGMQTRNRTRSAISVQVGNASEGSTAQGGDRCQKPQPTPINRAQKRSLTVQIEPATSRPPPVKSPKLTNQASVADKGADFLKESDDKTAANTQDTAAVAPSSSKTVGVGLQPAYGRQRPIKTPRPRRGQKPAIAAQRLTHPPHITNSSQGPARVDCIDLTQDEEPGPSKKNLSGDAAPGPKKASNDSEDLPELDESDEFDEFDDSDEEDDMEEEDEEDGLPWLFSAPVAPRPTVTSQGGEDSAATPPSPKNDSCPVCLEDEPVHPVVLVCGHRYCYLCAKGLIVGGDSLCSLCRRPIPRNYLKAHVLKGNQGKKSVTPVNGTASPAPPTQLVTADWFYQSGNGRDWWQFEERNSQDLEDFFKVDNEGKVDMLICGQIYIIDFKDMTQRRKNGSGRIRRIKRGADPGSLCLGVAGIKN